MIKNTIIVFLLCCVVGLSFGQIGADIYIDSSNNNFNSTNCGIETQPCNNITDAITAFKSLHDETEISVIFYLTNGTYLASAGNSDIDVYGFKSISIQPHSNAVTDVIWDGESTFSFLKVRESDYSKENNISYPTGINIFNINFQNSYSSYNGGIFNIKLTLNHSSVAVTLKDCDFLNNTLNQLNNNTEIQIGSGSVLYFETGENVTALSQLDITSCKFQDSKARNSLIFINSTLMPVTISLSNFNNNYANNIASCLYSMSQVSLQNTVFDSNSAERYGGALYLDGASVTNSIDLCKFTNNQAGSGGAIAIGHALVKLIETEFTSNFANVNGGAIYATTDISLIQADSCTFTQNIAASGGAIFQDASNSGFFINATTFINNTAISGAALFIYGTVGILDSTEISLCNAEKSGGAIASYSSSLTTQNSCTISNNVAEHGGSIFCSSSKLNITSTIFQNNTDMGTASSEEAETGGHIEPNDSHIYCSLLPSYQYCVVVGDPQFTSYCGEQSITEVKSGLSAGQVAGIVIGSVLGAGILAFGFAFLLSSKIGIKSYFRALKENQSDHSSDEQILS